jgi:hypothetical protein
MDLEVLEESLKELGFNKIKKDSYVRGYMGNKTKAQLVASIQNGYDAGFLKNGKSYDLIADFWGISNDNQKKLKEDLIQSYSCNIVKKEVLKEGYTISETEKIKDGSIKITVQKW